MDDFEHMIHSLEVAITRFEYIGSGKKGNIYQGLVALKKVLDKREKRFLEIDSRGEHSPISIEQFGIDTHQCYVVDVRPIEQPKPEPAFKPAVEGWLDYDLFTMSEVNNQMRKRIEQLESQNASK